ncbi:MAG TPA: hypothetical protein VFJ61_11985 [Solirubrobacterales bacterium]|nr:hypothetical protein [Solirubrobacterales bacterium]
MNRTTLLPHEELLAGLVRASLVVGAFSYVVEQLQATNEEDRNALREWLAG